MNNVLGEYVYYASHAWGGIQIRVKVWSFIRNHRLLVLESWYIWINCIEVDILWIPNRWLLTLGTVGCTEDVSLPEVELNRCFNPPSNLIHSSCLSWPIDALRVLMALTLCEVCGYLIKPLIHLLTLPTAFIVWLVAVILKPINWTSILTHLPIWREYFFDLFDANRSLPKYLVCLLRIEVKHVCFSATFHIYYWVVLWTYSLKGLSIIIILLRLFVVIWWCVDCFKRVLLKSSFLSTYHGFIWLCLNYFFVLFLLRQYTLFN
jgi:hypothetical protein